MAINAQTPQWLEALSARPFEGFNKLGAFVGRMASGAIDAALPSDDPEIDKKPYFDRFRTSLVNQRKADVDPQWRIKEVLARAQYEHGKMQAESMFLRGQVAFKQYQQQLQSEKEMSVLAEQARAKGGDPTLINYDGANPITRQQWSNAQLQYSRYGVGQREQEIRTQINDAAKKLLPDDYIKFVNMERMPNGLPSPQAMAFLNEASARAAKREEQKFDYQYGDKATSQMKNINAIFDLEAKAQELDEAGDIESGKKYREQAAMLKEQLKGQDIEITSDDQGRMMFRMGKGLKPTVATQTQAQQKLLKYENAMELISHLEQNLRSGHVGIAGVLGEAIGDRLLPQFGIDTSNQKRIDVRTALTALREGLLREMSDDPRFSNKDRDEIQKALPSTGALESLPDAMQRLGTVRRVLSNRGQVYSGAIGKLPPLWSLSPEEIGQAVADQKIDSNVAADALRRFHGYP